MIEGVPLHSPGKVLLASWSLCDVVRFVGKRNNRTSRGVERGPWPFVTAGPSLGSLFLFGHR